MEGNIRIVSFWFLGFILLTGSISGCSTLQISKYPDQPVEKYPYTISEMDALAVAVDPIVDNEESTKYFDVDLLTNGILPVRVAIENRSASASYVIDKDRFALLDMRTTGAWSMIEKVDSENAGEGLIWASIPFILLIPPGVIPYAILMSIGTQINLNANVRRHDFVVNELQTTTLSPGERISGFVYFPFPNGDVTQIQPKIHLEALNLGTHEWRGMDLPFNLKKQ